MSASKPRGKNWTPMEDEALCQAWLDVSQDPAIGINQKTENLYGRIYDKFVEICTESNIPTNPELRAPSGMKSRWHFINKCVSKFAGCMAQINACPQSGASPEDNLKKALALYTATEKVPFTMINCFRILECAPKWQQYHHTVKIPAAKRSIASTEVSTSNDGVEENPPEVPAQSKPSQASARPRGRDAAKMMKTNHSAGLELAKAGRILAEAASAKLEDASQRTQALKRIANHAIMSMDLSGLGSVAKQFYEVEQRRILAETLREAAALPEFSMEASPTEDLVEKVGDDLSEEEQPAFEPDFDDQIEFLENVSGEGDSFYE